MNTIHILWAEMKKSHRHHFNNRLVYFSLFLWPAILFIQAYFSFSPFNLGEDSPLTRFVAADQLGLYLIIGYLAYIFFWSLVQSAWQMAYERQQGTLELILLTPVNRTLFMFGRAAANLIEAVWLFSIFAIFTVVYIGELQIASIWFIPFAVALLMLSAIIWGGFLNVIFMFSRDAGILYTIFEAPMEFFSGVRMPIMAFPIWAKAIAFIFPLTYVLQIIRGFIMEGKTVSDMAQPLLLLAGILITLSLLTYWLVNKAERHVKKTGSLTLF